MTQRADINQVLSQMRTMQVQIRPPQQDVVQSTVLPSGQLNGLQQTPQFSELFSRAIDNVNEVQQDASALKQAYETGEAGITLTQVMIASEKASVSFQAMTQVRNKLVQAYEDIMNMPV